MKNKLFILVLMIIYLSCKPIHETEGIAQNAKDGAIIRVNQSTYVVENLKSWNDSILDKTVVINYSIINSTKVSENDLIDKNGMHKQGRLGNNVRIKLINIRINKP